MSGIKTTFVVPKWENKTAPCAGVNGCPAGTNIAGALYALSRGQADHAWQIMMESHPLRSVLGRVCYNFCEKPCNRVYFDTPVAIQRLEMALSDEGFDAGWRPKMKRKNNKKVAIIGAGPAGLTAAYFLVRAGYAVEMFDAQDKPGGMLRYGIPEYRLDKSVLDREVDFILSLGVTLNSGHRLIGRELKSLLNGTKFQAVLVSTGADQSISADIEGKTENGLEFLRATQSGKKISLKGKSVVVIGGGNTAMDSCRTAVRLGAKPVIAAYRRTMDEMPAHYEEYIQAREEGVEFRFLLTPVSFDGKVVKFQKNRLGQSDESGRRKPEPIPGEMEEIQAEKVFTAIGQKPSEWEIPEDNRIFFAGDVLPDSPGTVIHAIAGGKRAADEIHRKLSGGRKLLKESLPEVPYEDMNVLRYYQKRMRLRSPLVPAGVRSKNFDDMLLPLNKGEAMLEADRCFKCGTCVGGAESTCDWCFHACDHKGLQKKMEPWDPEGVFFEISEECDGCGKCWEDCPRNVVTPSVLEE
ncbi:MAG: hypothetical protein IEMM0002_0337 [bacterium]|nr:MAG: hypothetical protein IEMM0002_0337 [bacterium]